MTDDDDAGDATDEEKFGFCLIDEMLEPGLLISADGITRLAATLVTSNPMRAIVAEN